MSLEIKANYQPLHKISGQRVYLVTFLLSGVMLMIAILIAAIIKTFEDRERKLLEGKDPDRQ